MTSPLFWERIEHFEILPDEALLSAREVGTIAHRSRASLWRDVAAGRLARPIKLGGATRWRARDVRHYLAR